jgi:ATP/maltotriose-dependent transcriptional regulator MalT
MTTCDRYRDAASELLKTGQSEHRAASELLLRLAFLQRFSAPAEAIASIEQARRLQVPKRDPVYDAERLWVHGSLLIYLNRISEGLALLTAAVETVRSLPEDARFPDYTILQFIAGQNFLQGSLTNGAPPAEGSGGWSLREVLEAHVEICAWLHAAAGQAGPNEPRRLRPDEQEASPAAAFSAPWISLGQGIAAAALGLPEEARVAFAESRERFDTFAHYAMTGHQIMTESADVAATYELDEPAYRRALAREGEAALRRAGGALRSGLSPRIAWLRCLVLDGHWAEAADILNTSPTPGNAFLWRNMRWASAELARHQGEPKTAWEQIGQVFPDGASARPGDVIFHEGLELKRLAADLCIDAGDLAAVRLWLESHDTWLSWSGTKLGVAGGELGWARLRFAEGNADEARARAANALALAANPDQPGVLLGAYRLLGDLELHTGRIAEAMSHLLKSLELAEACELPFERALSLLLLAEANLGDGDVTEAVRLLEGSRSVLSALGALPALARANALAARLGRRPVPGETLAGLTSREVEVLRLIVAGRSNQEIADALFISWATARTHVANIFRKLDVGTRAEAVDAAHRRGLVSGDSTTVSTSSSNT